MEEECGVGWDVMAKVRGDGGGNGNLYIFFFFPFLFLSLTSHIHINLNQYPLVASKKCIRF